MWRYFFGPDEVFDVTTPLVAASDKISEDFLGLSSEFWAAVAGALIGGILSGIISYLLLRQAFGEARRQREEDAITKHKSLAYSLILKIGNLVTDLYRTWEALHETKIFIDQNKLEPWQRFLPIVNIWEKIYFSDDELGYLLSLRDDDVFNEVLGLDRIHNSTVEVITNLSTARVRLGELLPPPVAMDGQVGEAIIPRELYLSLRPRMVEINVVFDAEYKESKNRYLAAFKALKNLVELFNKKLALNYKIASEIIDRQLAADEPAVANAGANPAARVG